MNFTDRAFFYYFVAVYFVWLLIRHREDWTIPFLLVASLVFYGNNHWSLLPLLIVFCLIDWIIARRMEISFRPKRWLILGISFNLLILAYFKYTPMLVETFTSLFGGPPRNFDNWKIPYGISFYSFTGIAYLVDVYRKTNPAMQSLARYSLSAAFFPHLVAGPILRPHEFLNDLNPGRMPREPLAPREACFLVARGFFKKLVVADRIALAIDPFFAHVGDGTTAGVWSLPYIYLYAFQIYFDFSAYTDIARGLALLFGYRWPENFNRPYLATSVAEFWHRWHITLSRFLRDYLFIPLGGSRCGFWKTNRNLMITMLLGGLWHGANWSFMIWGGLHGSFLVLHRLWSRIPLRGKLQNLNGTAGVVWKLVCILLTFHAICLAWCFFRLTAWQQSVDCVRKVFDFDTSRGFVGNAYDPAVWWALLVYLLLSLLGQKLTEIRAIGSGVFVPSWKRGMAWGFGLGWIMLAILLAPDASTPNFIYFQF